MNIDNEIWLIQNYYKKFDNACEDLRYLVKNGK